MLVIGLTGGVGSGKSTVADLFATYGIPIIDADLIAREVMQPGESAYQTVLTHYGPTILLANDQIDRKQLREIIFEHPHERKWLEETLHPIIRQRIADRIPLLHAPYCIVVIPLLAESSPFPFLDRVIVIDTDITYQRDRLMKRDGISESMANAMISAQASREQRLALADDIIPNQGEQKELAAQIHALHQQYLKMC